MVHFIGFSGTIHTDVDVGNIYLIPGKLTI
jgi:hypothetical protein